MRITINCENRFNCMNNKRKKINYDSAWTKKLESLRNRMLAKIAIFRLIRSGDRDSIILANTLKSTLKNDLVPKEKVWIDKIEQLRENLNASTTEISLVDYGAGKSYEDRTQQDMYTGKTVTTTVGEVCRSGSKSPFWSFLLFNLVREFKPAVCIELGTCLGISTSYQAVALSLNKAGKIVTIEGAKTLAKYAEQNIETIGLENVRVVADRFQDVLDKVLNESRPVDFAFIDGHHDENATMRYFDQLIPFLANQGVVLVFDDISWSPGMKKAWKKIKVDERVKISVDLRKVGICLMKKKIEK